MSHINKTIYLLRERVGTYFPEFQGQKHIQINEKYFNEASTYPIHLVEIKSNNNIRKIIVKFAPFDSEFNEGLVEYTNMRNLQNNRSRLPSNIGLINCLDYIHESNALIMEFSEGDKFSKWFLINNTIFATNDIKKKIEYYIKTSGSWLYNFHLNNEFPNIKVKDSSITNSLTILLSTAKSKGLLNSINIDIKKSIQSKINDMQDYILPMALIHGDFGLQNINIQNDKIYVFDLQRDYKESIFYDVAYFCVTLDTLNPYPKHPFFSPSYSSQLKKAFIEGYFSKKLEKNEIEILDIYILLNLTQRCIKQYQNHKKRFGRYNSLLVKLLNFKFEKIIRNLLL